LALTFDDGPHLVYTDELLAVLAKTHTKATFFVIGKQVDKYPQLVRAEMLQGEEVGNHTYDHVNLTQIPPELIGFELDECDRAIKRACGATARFFRPPGGDYDLDVIREATRRSYITTLWTDDPGDYAKPGADVVLQRTLDRLENGAIILLHDGIPETVDILPALITEARKRGYEFVTLSELAKER
jgi:peptidoglycan/xylan/chitin deacetylase (PgdA/CDA1 family)